MTDHANLYPERSQRRCRAAKALAVACLAAGCAQPLPRPADYHLGRDHDQPGRSVAPPLAPGIVGATAGSTAESIPPLVNGPAAPPRPRNGPTLETYSVVVSQVEIGELLFAMARDARLNLDVHPALRGKVSINAIDQTLPQILNRLARQVPLRYDLDGRNLVVTPDTPFVRHYTVDYVNMTRDARANVSIATQISTTGGGNGGGGGGGGSQASNNSTTEIRNVSVNRFWETLIANVRSLVDDDPATRAAAQDGAAGAGGPGAGGAGGSGAGGSGAGGAGGAGGSGGSGGSGAAGAGGSGAAPAGGSGSGGAAAGPGGGSSSSSGSAVASAVSANPESGLMSVRATAQQHERVRTYLDRVMNSARRQVLIEATVAEVQLSEQFQQGINWQNLRLDGTGFGYTQQPGGALPLSTGTPVGSGPGGIVFPTNPAQGNLPGGASSSGLPTPSLAVLRYLSPNSNFAGAISLLQSFGKVKVLSSPKISVLNNQTAMLKVVDNRVYFTIGVQVTPGTAGAAPVVSYTTTANTVPVGFVMSVTPQIEDTGSVTMNVRPTISRIIGFVNDPNPALAGTGVISRVPEIQTREMESILKVASGDVAVMGGLMQESVDDKQDMVPGAAAVPWLGQLFRYRNDSSSKTELVVFLRPVVIRDASMDGDFRHLKSLLPTEDFFNTPVSTGIPRAWSREGGGR